MLTPVEFTVARIIAKNIIGSAKSVALLAGIPKGPDQIQKFGAAGISVRVIESNKVIFQILEIASSAQKEPSFRRQDWEAAVDLLSNVVRSRFCRTQALQQDLRLSDEEVYDLVFRETLSLAIKIEKLSIQPGLEILLRARNHDPLKLLSCHDDIDDMTKGPCLRFVDEFTRARDAITKDYRRSTTPVVFPDLNILHPVSEDYEIKSAFGFGSYIEGYRSALSIYVN